MKDLKHLIFFENLLQDAQNELVTQAVNDGKIALGYNCYYIPEVLLNLPGCFSTRLRPAAPARMSAPSSSAPLRAATTIWALCSAPSAALPWSAWRSTSSCSTS